MHGGHDIVPQFRLIGRGLLKIDVIEGGFQFLKLLGGDWEAKFVL